MDWGGDRTLSTTITHHPASTIAQMPSINFEPGDDCGTSQCTFLLVCFSCKQAPKLRRYTLKTAFQPAYLGQLSYSRAEMAESVADCLTQGSSERRRGKHLSVDAYFETLTEPRLDGLPNRPDYFNPAGTAASTVHPATSSRPSSRSALPFLSASPTPPTLAM
ncbi:unnamed protein product [Protopolystoma xenopodis]|uniref:Uncharacterized protein n=1 Tax=Protopolystoma xenopodis TaxID=117903 RepID=A0A3S5AG50_9PLAT|nr:unnamed protein product [Protopolystoma xenopodis]